MKTYLKLLLLSGFFLLPSELLAQRSIVSRVSGGSASAFAPQRMRPVASSAPAVPPVAQPEAPAAASPAFGYPSARRPSTAMAVAGGKKSGTASNSSTAAYTSAVSTKSARKKSAPSGAAAAASMRGRMVARSEDFAARDVSVAGLELARRTLSTASQFLGVRYDWGGTTPNGFDCSGFIQYVYRKQGLELPRNSRQQAVVGRPVPVRLDALRPGDLIFFASNGTYINHVGMYAGNNQMIHSSSAFKGVVYLDLSSPKAAWYRNHMVKVRRVVES